MHHRHQHSRKRGRKLSRPAYEDDNTALVMTNSFSTRATPAAGCCRNRNQAAAHTSKPSHAPGTSGHLRAPVLSWPGHAELPLTSRGESEQKRAAVLPNTTYCYDCGQATEHCIASWFVSWLFLLCLDHQRTVQHSSSSIHRRGYGSTSFHHACMAATLARLHIYRRVQLSELGDTYAYAHAHAHMCTRTQGRGRCISILRVETSAGEVKRTVAQFVCFSVQYNGARFHYPSHACPSCNSVRHSAKVDWHGRQSRRVAFFARLGKPVQ